MTSAMYCVYVSTNVLLTHLYSLAIVKLSNCVIYTVYSRLSFSYKIFFFSLFYNACICVSVYIYKKDTMLPLALYWCRESIIIYEHQLYDHFSLYSFSLSLTEGHTYLLARAFFFFTPIKLSIQIFFSLSFETDSLTPQRENSPRPT